MDVPGAPDRAPSQPAPEPNEVERVTIEIVAWVTRFVGGDGTRRMRFAEPLAPGATVRILLRAFSRRFPQLEDALWDRRGGGLAEHIEVLVNDAVLGVTHTLDSPLKAGDHVTLVGAFIGG